jgi:magnesium transporter
VIVDCAHYLRAKIERYEQSEITFAVLRTARYLEETEEVDFGEVSVFVGRQFVITVRQGQASALPGARERLEARPDLLEEARTQRCGRSWTRSSTTTALW